MMFTVANKYTHYNFNNLAYFRFDNRIEIVRISDNKVVDTYGKATNNSPSASNPDPAYGWVTPSGYFKRKDNRYANTEFHESDWIICPSCLDKLVNSTSVNPYPVDSLVIPATTLYHGINDDTLRINGIPRSFDRYGYRARGRRSTMLVMTASSQSLQKLLCH